MERFFLEEVTQSSYVLGDFAELVCPIGAGKLPKFAKINLQTFLFYDSIPKNAEKWQLLMIFDFALDQNFLEEVTLKQIWSRFFWRR